MKSQMLECGVEYIEFMEANAKEFLKIWTGHEKWAIHTRKVNGTDSIVVALQCVMRFTDKYGYTPKKVVLIEGSRYYYVGPIRTEIVKIRKKPS